VVEQLPHGLDLEPYGVQRPPVEGLPGEQLTQLLIPLRTSSMCSSSSQLLPAVRSPTLVDAFTGLVLRCVLWRGPVAAGLPWRAGSSSASGTPLVMLCREA
jgi:hypothetical protein